MNPPGQPVTPPAEAASTVGWRRRVIFYISCVVLIAVGVLIGLIGVIKVKGVEYPLNVETREGCLADPSLVTPWASCPHEAEAILRHPDGRTEVIRGTPQQVKRRVAQVTDQVVAAQRWRGVGYLLVATLLVGVGVAAIAWRLVGRGPRLFRASDQPGGDATSSPAG